MSWMRLSSIPMGSRCIVGAVVLSAHITLDNYIISQQLNYLCVIYIYFNVGGVGLILNLGHKGFFILL